MEASKTRWYHQGSQNVYLDSPLKSCSLGRSPSWYLQHHMLFLELLMERKCCWSIVTHIPEIPGSPVWIFPLKLFPNEWVKRCPNLHIDVDVGDTIYTISTAMIRWVAGRCASCQGEETFQGQGARTLQLHVVAQLLLQIGNERTTKHHKTNAHNKSFISLHKPSHTSY